MSLCLRHVVPEDSDLLLQWRNDPETRRNSIQTGRVSLKEHTRWFQRMISMNPQRVSVGELDGVPVGVIRLDWNEARDSCEVSFTVAPEHRRKGIGFRMIQCVVESLSRVRVVAKVKVGNLGSRRIFDQLGFCVTGREGELLLYARDPADAVMVATKPFHPTETVMPRALL